MTSSPAQSRRRISTASSNQKRIQSPQIQRRSGTLNKRKRPSANWQRASCHSVRCAYRQLGPVHVQLSPQTRTVQLSSAQLKLHCAASALQSWVQPPPSAAATGAGEVARGFSIALLVAAASITGEGARRTVFALLPAATAVAGRRADHLNGPAGV